MSQLSNVESLLTAIAKGDSSYLVEPQSRVEALLYEIYMSGGGGGTGDITRAEVLRLLEDKVDKLVGYGLISDEEAERLKNVDNYDDSEVRGLITDISNSIIDLKDTIKGTADGQFIYDSEVKMTKVVPDGVNKGVVAMIGGKTVKMVQMVNGLASDIKTPGITITYDNGIVSLSGTATTDINTPLTNPISFVSGHKTLIKGCKRITPSNRGSICISAQVVGSVMFCRDDTVVTPVATIESNLRLVLYKDDVVTASSDSFIPMVFDLTAMFGAGNEPTVEEFNTMFPDVYYSYTDGELWNAPVTEITYVGKNCFDEIMEIGELNISTGLPIVSTTNLRTVNYQKVKPSTTYYLLTVGANANLCFYNSNKEFISSLTGINNNTFTTPSSCAYMKFRLAAAYGLTYNHDVAIIEGGADVYTPYTKTTLLLDKIVDNLPDYGCSAGDVYNYIDFEEMVYHHKVGKVDLGSFTWRLSSDKNSFKTVDSLNTPAITITTAVANILFANYDNVSASGFTGDNQICCYNKQPAVRDSKYASLTPAEFKTAMTGKELLYELAEEELIPLTDLLLPFKCEPGGTVTFENEHNLDVPNSIIYEKEMK